MSAETYNGKCHCGQTEWTAKLGESSHILCHCDTCKVLSGGPYTLNQIIPADNFNITKGKDDIKDYTYKGDSGKSVHCYYCSNCTTHVYHQQELMGTDKVIVRTMTLDKGKDFTPGIEIYGKAKMNWEPEVGKQTFPGLPE